MRPWGLSVLWWPVALAAQGLPFEHLADGTRVAAIAVPECPHAVVAVLWPVGSDHDPVGGRGIAAAIAQWRLLRLRTAWGPEPGLQCGIDVRRDHVQLWAQAASDHVPRLLAGVAAALAPAPAASTDLPDLPELALARAALAADDAAFVLPGPRLQAQAWRRLVGVHQPPTGSTAELRGIGTGLLVAAAAAQPRPRVLVLGGIGEAAATALTALGNGTPAAAPTAWPAPAPTVEFPDVAPYAQVLAPFAACAFQAPAPAADVAAAHALAMAVLRQRAARRFADGRGRGVREAAAATPPLAFDWLAGDPVVMLYRRGRDGAAWSSPRGELDQLLASARTEPVTAAELQLAVDLLQRQYPSPPYAGAQLAELAATPALLPGRAGAALLVEFRGAKAALAQLPMTPLAAVQAALAQALQPSGLWWGGLVPTLTPGAEAGPR